MSEQSLRVTITGASGFIGRELLSRVPPEWRVAGLTRSLSPERKNQKTAVFEWRQVDLFSVRSATEALADTDVAIYLVHSMLPSTRLFQGNFADADLLIADNFASACVKNGVKQIIYLGGLMPTGKVSKHLNSRHEVEAVLKATGIPCTILRAGMIAGQGGSSYDILRNLTRNLPAMILPLWTQSKTQAVYVDDVVRVVKAAVNNPEYLNRVINVVNGETLIYEDLIRASLEVQRKKPRLLHIPFNPTQLSKFWVSIFGRAPYELVSPLIDSLLCELPQAPPEPLIAELIHFKTFRAMLAEIEKKPVTAQKRPARKPAFENSVRSIQRLPTLPTMDVSALAKTYERWLPAALKGLIRVTSSERKGFFHVLFYMRGLRWPLLILRTIPENDPHRSRIKFHIVGGLLSKRSDCGWLEFRQVANRKFTLASINDFVPTLPWYLYRFSQAVVHQRVMRAFARSLEKTRLTEGQPN